MIHYILENNLYFKEYVVQYTNAALIVKDSFGFKDGLFSGYNPETRKYDQSKWGFETDAEGIPKKDPELKHERCVFQLMKDHYSRYTIDKVSDITGVSLDNLLRVYKAYAATGNPEKSGTVLYALGWTQHTVGVQNIRSAGIVQLLLGNMGVPAAASMPCAVNPMSRAPRTMLCFTISCPAIWPCP